MKKPIDYLQRAHEVLEYVHGNGLPPEVKTQIAGAMYYLEKHMTEKKKVFVVMYIDHEDGACNCDVFLKYEDAITQVKQRYDETKEDACDDDRIFYHKDDSGNMIYFYHADDGGTLLYECVIREEVTQ